jgi:hypothetical protein
VADFHELHLTTSPAGLLFECVEGCGRRLVVDRVSGGLTIIDRGDPLATHRGSHSDLSLSLPALG